MDWRKAMEDAVKVKKAEQERTSSSSAGKSSDSSAFAITAQGKSGRAQQLRRRFKATEDVSVLRRAICDEMEGTLEVDVFVLGKIMQDGNTLGSYGIDGAMTVTIARKLRGGAALPTSEPSWSVHVFDKKKHSSFKTTTKADDLMCIDDSDNPRVVAPCGKHAFCAETYFQLTACVLRADGHSHQVFCPMSGCGVEIPFEFITKAACLTDDERSYYAMHFGMRAVKKATRECPSCSAMCSRPDKLDYVRVSCGCGGGDFCFQCGHKWIGGGFQVCGNKDCPTYGLQVAISSCEMVELTGGHKCPKLRACPKCLSLISFTTACKHMRCQTCQYYFCYLCLKEATKECIKTTHSEYCEIAARQTLK